MQKWMTRRLKGNDEYNIPLRILISSKWCAGTLGGDETLCAEPVRELFSSVYRARFFSLGNNLWVCICVHTHESTHKTAMMKEENFVEKFEFSTMIEHL